ncbi:hypothetical protein ACFL2Q_00910 [Thermodesulfobacteriota bacterium]
MAAEQGLHKAQYILGVILEFGLEVKTDLKKAEYWYKKSAEQGYKDAMEALERVRKARSQKE